MTAIVKRLGNPCRISPELNFSRFTDEDSRPVSWQKMDAGLAPKSSDLSARGGPTRSFLVRYGIYPALKGLYPEPARPRRGCIQSLLGAHQFRAGAALGHTRPSLVQIHHPPACLHTSAHFVVLLHFTFTATSCSEKNMGLGVPRLGCMSGVPDML